MDSLIKLRHLKTASENNWEMLTNTQTMVYTMINEATQIMNTIGNGTGTTQYNKDSSLLSNIFTRIQHNKNEYLQAVKEIEEENIAADNLWDRFLNIFIVNIPFKQTPEERVMMRR